MLFISLDDLDLIPSIPIEVNGIELRLDLFQVIDLDKIQTAIISSSIPILLTLRKASHGGSFLRTELDRMNLIQRLLFLKPAFFDLEYDMDSSFIIDQMKNHPEVKFILSHHDFTKTPLDIEEVYQEMLSYPVYGYKIATLVSSARETLSLLLLSKKHPKLSIIPMGEIGSFGRVLSSL
ncbi:MAG: type I 3-dehydroquinate dehydratase [Chlamydiota bacterium]